MLEYAPTESSERLLRDKIDPQETADMAHAILAGLDDDDGQGGDDDESMTLSLSSQAGYNAYRYVAILKAGGEGGRASDDLVWSESAHSLRTRDRGRGDTVPAGSVPTGAAVTVNRSFVVMDTGMTVRADTECDVIQGNEEQWDEGGDSTTPPSHIYVRFSHPEPPWAVLVGRLDGMSTELQVRRVNVAIALCASDVE